MRKIVVLILTLMLVLSMTVPAFAVTPRLAIPKLPKVPTISFQWKWGF